MARVLVEYSQRLQQAVDAALGTPELSVHTTRRERGRSALSDMSDAVSSDYNGYFKVIDASETAEDGTKTLKLKVVDGNNIDSNFCGSTDLGNVEKATIDYSIPESGTSIVYLLVNWQVDKYVFSFQFGGDVPTSPTGFCALADINKYGVIRQLWTDGVIYFSERYYT